MSEFGQASSKQPPVHTIKDQDKDKVKDSKTESRPVPLRSVVIYNPSSEAYERYPIDRGGHSFIPTPTSVPAHQLGAYILQGLMEGWASDLRTAFADPEVAIDSV